jgi:hypothetical protein
MQAAQPAPLLPLVGGDLEDTLAAVETRLSALGKALLERDSNAIDLQATELQSALARAVECFSQAARLGALPAPLRQRLMRASSQVAAQRESFARATAALDRAIDVLLPRDASGLYAAHGGAERRLSGGVLQA